MKKRFSLFNFNTRLLVQYAIFIAIIFVMKITGLSSIPVGPFNMTLTMVPIAVGAMLLGPVAGGVFGFVYGLTSLYDAITGASVMTGVFFQISPFHTIVLCVVTRTLVGVATGWLFRLFRRLDRHRIWCYFAGGLAAPVLNTLLFMGYTVLVFYNSPFVQDKVQALGASGPIMYVVLAVGIQGLVEALTGCIVGGAVAKGVAKALKMDKPEAGPQPVKAEDTAG